MSKKSRSECLKELEMLFDYYYRDKAEQGRIIVWTKNLMKDIRKLDAIWKDEKQLMLDRARSLLSNMGAD